MFISITGACAWRSSSTKTRASSCCILALDVNSHDMHLLIWAILTKSQRKREVQTKVFKPYKMTLFPNNVMMIILVYIIKSISTYNIFVILIHANLSQAWIQQLHTWY